jgi:hypothetical protein
MSGRGSLDLPPFAKTSAGIARMARVNKTARIRFIFSSISTKNAKKIH